MTLREYISFWQETYDRQQSRPTTYAAHNYVFKNHILPGLGDIPLSELTSEMAGEFLEERRRFGNHRPGSSGLGEETMRHIHRLLQQCLDQAIRDGLLTENAIDGRLRRMEDYIARSSFTRNVEQDMTNGIIAEAFEMDREDLKRRRAQSVRNVKATNGLISLEKYARSRQEQDWDDDEWQD